MTAAQSALITKDLQDDEKRWLELFRLTPPHRRADLLATTSAELVVSLVDEAIKKGNYRGEEPSSRDETEYPYSFVDELLWDIKPAQEPWDYLDESLRMALEWAWNEGFYLAILGAAENDEFYAGELMEAVERFAEDAGNTEDPWFGVPEMVNFIRAWRGKWMRMVGELHASVTDDAS